MYVIRIFDAATGEYLATYDDAWTSHDAAVAALKTIRATRSIPRRYRLAVCYAGYVQN